MNQKDAFLKALADNEDDTATRLVYADWLDEHGEHDEADRMRKWPAAKAWLVKLCERHNYDEELDDVCREDDMRVDYVYLLTEARKGLLENDLSISGGNNMDMTDALREHAERFWRTVSVLTGLPLPPDFIEKARFRCAC